MQYCGYCVKIINRSNLWRHCLADHDKKTCALAAGDTPPDPFCLNWPEYIKDPANTVPELKVGIFNKSFDPKSNFINNDSSSDKSEDDEEESNSIPSGDDTEEQIDGNQEDPKTEALINKLKPIIREMMRGQNG